MLTLKREALIQMLTCRSDPSAVVAFNTVYSIEPIGIGIRAHLTTPICYMIWYGRCQFRFKFVSYCIKMTRLESGVDEIIVAVRESALKIRVIQDDDRRFQNAYWGNSGCVLCRYSFDRCSHRRARMQSQYRTSYSAKWHRAYLVAKV